MKVSDVMTSDVRFCGPATNLAEVVAKMWDGDCGILPVVGEDGKVIGVVTDRDICIALGTRDRRPSEVAAHEVMTTNVTSCLPKDTLRSAMAKMRDRRVRRLPVIGPEGDLLGLLSIDDIASRAEGRPDAEVTFGDVAETLKAIREQSMVRTAVPL